MDAKALKNAGKLAKNVKKGYSSVKKITKIPETVLKGVGVGIKAIEYIHPETSEKIRKSLTSFQDEIETRGQSMEKLADYLESKLDHSIGEPIEQWVAEKENQLAPYEQKIKDKIAPILESVNNKIQPVKAKLPAYMAPVKEKTQEVISETKNLSSKLTKRQSSETESPLKD